jgi:hypothetical protein
MVNICTSRINNQYLCILLLMGFALFSLQTFIISLNRIKKLSFVMVKSCVLFEVRTEYLNVI